MKAIADHKKLSLIVAHVSLAGYQTGWDPIDRALRDTEAWSIFTSTQHSCGLNDTIVGSYQRLLRLKCGEDEEVGQ